jgi:hypothetical protein
VSNATVLSFRDKLASLKDITPVHSLALLPAPSIQVAVLIAVMEIVTVATERVVLLVLQIAEHAVAMGSAVLKKFIQVARRIVHYPHAGLVMVTAILD